MPSACPVVQFDPLEPENPVLALCQPIREASGVRSFLGFLLLILGCGVLHGHIIQQIPMDLELKDGNAEAQLTVDASYMMAEFRGDDNQIVPDLEWLRSLSAAQKDQLKVEAEAYLRQCLTLLSDDRVMDWKMTFPDLDGPNPAYMTEGDPSDIPVLRFGLTAEFPDDASKLSVDWNEPFGVVLLVKTHSGADIKTIPVVEGKAVVAERNAAGEIKAEDSTFGHWVMMGYRHILPEGLDHILFVLGLFLLVPKWKPLLQQTITFTIAHSISLAAVVLYQDGVEPKWAEAAIAASIAWVGIENLWTKEVGKGRLYLVGLFGLIHGMGFAGAIKSKMPLETPGALAPALLGFNLGVEGGQVTVLIIAFIAFAWWGKKFVWVKRTGSVFIGLSGLLLLIHRAFGVQIDLINWLQ
jgi:hypothetical protein